MTPEEAIEDLKRLATKKTLNGMDRYGIPNDRAFGVTMGDMKRFAKQLGTDHRLATALWKTGWYEARTVAVFVDDPVKVSGSQMDRWAKDFDNWAICDTACFHLFDKTPHAWAKVHQWAPSSKEFVRRAAFALIWALSVHDKSATNRQFTDALGLIEQIEADERPLVKKGIDMALRAAGKRNQSLNRESIRIAKRLSQSDHAAHAWIGRHALRELTSEKVQKKLSS